MTVTEPMGMEEEGETSEGGENEMKMVYSVEVSLLLFSSSFLFTGCHGKKRRVSEW